MLRPQTELGRCSTTSSSSGTTRRQKPPRLACAQSRIRTVATNILPTYESARQGSYRTGGSTLSDFGLGRSSTPIKAVVKYAEVASHPKPPIYQQKPAIQQAEWYSAKHDYRPFEHRWSRNNSANLITERPEEYYCHSTTVSIWFFGKQGYVCPTTKTMQLKSQLHTENK